MVWPVLREQDVRTGHNVVVYWGADGGLITIDAGVEVFTDFSARGEVRRICTPSGDMATTAHYGEYSDMAPAYGAIERWCNDNGRGLRASTGKSMATGMTIRQNGERTYISFSSLPRIEEPRGRLVAGEQAAQVTWYY